MESRQGRALQGNSLQPLRKYLMQIALWNEGAKGQFVRGFCMKWLVVLEDEAG